MKFGVNTFIWTANFAPRDIPLMARIRAAGFDSIEIPILAPVGFDAAAVRREAEANGLDLTVCAVMIGELSLISPDPAVRRRARDHVEAVVRCAAEAGSHLVAGPLYAPVGFFTGTRRTPEEWDRAVDAYQSLGTTLEDSDLVVAIEPLNRFETYFLNTASDAARLCDEIGHPRVGILFDTFHANIEEKDVASGLRTAARHLRHVHTCENDRGTPGAGHVDWPGVFQALAEIGYDARLTIESFGFSLGELAAAASIWRDLADTPEQIAFEGVQFLKRMASTSSALSPS